MPITPPILDDLTYDTAFTELKRRIPQYAPDWTNWNDSDPGITLLQLFAHLADQICWRLNRIPEKNHVELLKLLGVTLKPAEAAATRVALLMDKPSATVAGTLAAGTQFQATSNGQKLIFETTAALDTVPCEVAAVVTTKNPSLTDLLKLDDGTVDPEATQAEITTAGESPEHNKWLSLRWDGKKPKLKDMPAAPIDLLPTDHDHKYIWLGLNFNTSPQAGFLGVKVTLTVQFDDDELPSQTATEMCGPMEPTEDAAPTDEWIHGLDSNGQAVGVADSGPVVDSTSRFTTSGTVSFFVPAELATPAPWADLRKDASDPLAVCAKFGEKVIEKLEGIEIDPGDCQTVMPLYVQEITAAMEAGAKALEDAVGAAEPQVIHPIAADFGALAGWLRITLGSSSLGATSPKLRILSFNAVAVVNRTTVTGELLGTSTGEAGQTFQLRNTNIQPGTLKVEVQEGPAEDSPLTTWNDGDLDAAAPTDRTFEIDWEAGVLTFGDGDRGMIPPAVPDLGRIIARSYAWGGGEAGNIKLGEIKSYSNASLGVTGAVNFVNGQGGKDAEDLDDAKVRARKEISSRSRAVTTGDFEFIATQTEGVRVAMAHAVPLRIPLAAGATFYAVTGSCGDAVPANPNDPGGLASGPTPGAVSIIVVPDVEGPEPTPTASFLKTVCRHLDNHRLVTTEVHVVSPQYCRICSVKVDVTARSGYTRAALQDAVAARLEEYLHVLHGGTNGTGYGFGTQVLAADLIAQIFRVEGVETVREFECGFVRTKTDASPREGRLMMCPPSDESDAYDRVDLSPEETASIVPSTVTLSVVV